MIIAPKIPVSKLAKNIPKILAIVPRSFISKVIPGILFKNCSKYSPKNIAPTPTNADVIIFETWAILIAVE